MSSVEELTRFSMFLVAVMHMADMQLREKIKKITAAAKQNDSIPERSKNIGLIIFLILFGCGTFVLFALAIGLTLNGHFISAVVLFLITTLLVYSVVKMMTAEDIQPL
ncbi:hypothetical protein [Sporosarcina sp. YIM B06819]|uniref:hypothetical protein n=1 Tax=Sporosarcina sp. YIM B06819 TaxID=3081769 RepID=UPI00298D4E7B|nr:hypothetical protein [Sporosarcina sp. YIM B06819]